MEPEIIFRKMCVGALQMKIFEMIKTVQKMQMEIKRESQQKMKDRIKMYDNSMEDDELEELIKDPEVKLIRLVPIILIMFWESILP